MPRQEKKIKGRNTQPMLLVPMTATLFLKKTVQIKPESNTLDFHLDIIKKIDKLLADHQQEIPPVESFPTPPVNPPSPPTPIEPRPPLNKTFPHEEIAWDSSSDSMRVVSPIVPEEFKTEISFNPTFRFITSQEFIDTISQKQLSSEDRVEIIDFNTLIKDDAGFHKTPEVTSIKDLKNNRDALPFKHLLFDEDIHHKKIEIIDTRTLKQKNYENVLSASEEQAEQIDKKAQLFFLNSKNSTEKKQRSLDDEQQSSIPEDLDEQSKELKRKLIEEEKKLRQLEHEYEKLERMEKKKTTTTEKKQIQGEKVLSKKEQRPVQSNKDLKKQEKEQKRLKRLQIRQARIEERRRKKLEKQALKLKQKQQNLKMKGNKHQQKTGKTDTFKGDKNNPVLLLDEDLIKVLHMTDNLLGELPDDILNDFVESKDYKLYEKVMSKYKIK